MAVPRVAAAPGAMIAPSGHALGASVVARPRPEFLKPLVFALLTVLGGYAIFRRDTGKRSTEPVHGMRFALSAVAIGGGIGFEDGSVGPGSGALLIVLLVRPPRMSCLCAVVSVKQLELATSRAASGFFAGKVELSWKEGALKAVPNPAGVVLG